MDSLYVCQKKSNHNYLNWSQKSIGAKVFVLLTSVEGGKIAGDNNLKSFSNNYRLKG